jgi:outer membrane protein assembly factor BamB
MKRCLVAPFLLLLALAVVRADNWPQWRGPTNDGICKETKLPTEWSATQNIAWKLPLPGRSGATPAIWGDRIFVPSPDGTDIMLFCISTEGKVLWKQKYATGDRTWGPGDEKGNNASPSPSTDGQHVFVFAGTGDFACFDFDGKEVWHFNAQDRYGKFQMQWGTHTSPLLDGDRLYLQLLHSKGQWVIALDKATGKEVWKVQRESDGKGEALEVYTSPIIWRNGKDALLITHGNDYAVAHRLEDGKEVWRVGGLNPPGPGQQYNFTYRFVATPTAAEDIVVVPTAKGGQVVGVKPTANGKVLPGSEFELWRRPKGTPDVSSPLVHDGLVHLCRENGELICLEAKTGKELYAERLHSARYRASPVWADGKVYLTSRDGVVSVVKAGPKFELLSENKLPDQTAASPTISNGRIYLRGFEALYAIGAPAK